MLSFTHAYVTSLGVNYEIYICRSRLDAHRLIRVIFQSCGLISDHQLANVHVRVQHVFKNTTRGFGEV